ncbi:MAG: hypothetical protein VXZ55_06245 [Planctomycetota bacterium]|nr:hypothetical protein [Planctomycetota bacterium]
MSLTKRNVLSLSTLAQVPENRSGMEIDFSFALLGNLMIVTPSEVDVIRLWFFGNISRLSQAEYGRGRPKNQV